MGNFVCSDPNEPMRVLVKNPSDSGSHNGVPNCDICILMLGAGDSGKSTIFKQLKIIYNNSYQNSQERLEYTPFIIDNVITAIKVLVSASLIYNIPMEKPDNAQRAEIVKNFGKDILLQTELLGWGCLPKGFTANDIYELWCDPGIQETYQRRNEFHLDDNAPYFLSKLHELTRKNYIPSVQDVLRSRKKSVGVAEESFNVNKEKLKVVDVGGQKNERRKWINFFDGVDAVVYMSSLSEYDQVTYEDNKTSRLEDSIRLFSHFYTELTHAPIYLVLNKLDVLEEKVKEGRKMSEYFRDFRGDDNNVEDYKNFIAAKFKEVDKANRIQNIHFTSAVDINVVQFHVTEIIKEIMELKPKSAKHRSVPNKIQSTGTGGKGAA